MANKMSILIAAALILLAANTTAQNLDSIPMGDLWSDDVIAKYDSILQLNAAPYEKYATRELESIARELKATGNYIRVGVQPLRKSNVSYEVRRDDSGVITYIGTKLFSTNMMRKLGGRYLMICEFIERNNLYLRLLDAKKRPLVASALGLEYKEEDFFGINDSTDVQIIDFPEQNKYLFRWIDKSGKTLCDLKFPKSYSLISGLDGKECQIKLEKEIRNWLASGNVPKLNVDSSGLVPYNGIYVNKASYYPIAEITDNTYFEDPAGQKPVNSGVHPLETLANMFSGIVVNDVYANVTQQMYGFKKSNYTLKLSDMVDYFYANHCHPYFGVEKKTESLIEVTVIFRNTELCYNHLLYVKVHPKVLSDGAGEMSVGAYCFIPTHNLKSQYVPKTHK